MTTNEIWFVAGSQHLYGEEALRQVAENSQKVAEGLDASPHMPARIVAKPVMTNPSDIRRLCDEANASEQCAGLVLWMHTFSPGKMWIGGLANLRKPFAHLHTQFHRDLPFESIDMDFMNLHQSAHGDREAGHLHTRLGLRRHVVVGHWGSDETQSELGAWARVALGWQDLQGARFARFGDNMRQVSVTEGDKVTAEERFGFAVDGFGVGDLVGYVDSVNETQIDELLVDYERHYDIAQELRAGGGRRDSLRYSARIELGLRNFLTEGRFKGFTTTFEDLHGLRQLPGMAVQRLMADGFGFGAEGDWKTAALLRFTKVATYGLNSGSSFMEDYTYDLGSDRPRVLGAHMLEICPSIAKSKPRVEIHPLGIGGKGDPVRLVFDAKTGSAVNASLIDVGNRFRLIVNEVDAVDVPSMPNLPVARALWECRPDFKTAVTSWIYAGGAHHTVYTYALGSEQYRMLAEIAGIECLVIDSDTSLDNFRKELIWNGAVY